MENVCIENKSDPQLTTQGTNAEVEKFSECSPAVISAHVSM